jgi:hypothetical protein
MMTAELVHRRVANFWGYGSFKAPTWFVGMEEGLGPETELEERFRVSGKATIDIRRDMARIPHAMRWFQPPRPPIQQSWKYPVALYLYLRDGRAPNREEIRAYQLHILGDIDREDSCVIELMPLPARSTRDEDWLYLKYVGTRQQFFKRYRPERVRQLRDLITTHRPHLVIFYGMTYVSDWVDVIGQSARQITRQMYFAPGRGAASCIVPNNSRGMSYDRLYEFAERVRPQVSLR